jgi:uncharacterized protein YqjF (DUF2071 family)
VDVPLEGGWQYLLFENWPVDPAVMDAHLPDRLDPDAYDGSAWLSVVPSRSRRLTGEPFSAPDDPFGEFRRALPVLHRGTGWVDAVHGRRPRPWTLYPAIAEVEPNTPLSAHGFARPEAEPVSYYSPGLDVIASRSRRERD